MKLLRYLILFLPMVVFFSCHKPETLFEKISSSQSGIVFNNTITESDSLNPMNVVNLYNGGGVGIGDFNNDGLQDVFFTGNMVPSALYLNKGDFHFEDVTRRSGVEGKERWARGVSIVDINNDGLMDIYICNTIYKDSSRRRNILYVNQGIAEDGVPVFKDLAAEYGLDAHMQSTMASFFDYDNDGDLDVYVAVNEAYNGSSSSVFQERNMQSMSPSRGRLYRNDFDPALRHGVFHDVSKQAGIVFAGFGHAATVCDINQDGWKDIYVSNDFLSENILYINNHDGTFTNRAKEYFKHTSFNAMGQDVVDLNNDGLPDVIELDMNPRDNYRKKMMLSANNYSTFQNFERLGYQYQYVRNTLQLNQGRRLLEGDSLGAPVFSEIGFLSGLAETDWSWTPLVADFDNDGFRDVVITNGFPRDVSDHDFIAYRDNAFRKDKGMELLDKIPVIKIPNYGFRNVNGIQFADASQDWGLTTESFSNGAAYADLDNDGDIDMIVNNINDEPFVYRNKLREKNDSSAHYLTILFQGDDKNIHGLGATADIYYDHGQRQAYENNPYRGYLSTDQAMAHFGLGKCTLVDSVVVRWHNDRVLVLRKVKADQVLNLRISDAAKQPEQTGQLATRSIFQDITRSSGITYRNVDFDFIDFNIQTTLPHKLSQYSPGLAAGDLDGNGLADLVIGGNFNNPATAFFQQKDGKFVAGQIQSQKDSLQGVTYKDEGILLFDANGDGRNDIYLSSGGYRSPSNSPDYQDRLYINDSKGRFHLDTGALPINHTSKLCVRSFDYNHDGRADLFVSGRVDPWHYPKAVSSFIFRNDSENGHAKFTDVTGEVAPGLQNIGLVCDALFTDFDNDGQTDLIVAGEWMPLTFLKWTGKRFENVTALMGLADQPGWWNSIAAGDFRHTGRTDYIVGNLGENSLYHASPERPAFITAKDFDHNGGYEAIPSLFLPATDGTMKEYPAHGRDDILDKLPGLKKRFNNYHSFAMATMDSVLTAEQRKDAQRLKAVNLKSVFLRNDGNGKFTAVPLPLMAQVSALNGMVVDDFDNDGNQDVLINGNDYATEVSVGRYDALNGLLLKGDGHGGFTPLSIEQSGIYIPGDGKALVSFPGAGNRYLVAASQNQGELKLFGLRKNIQTIKWLPGDQWAQISYLDGRTEKKEHYCGSSFLSQSAEFFAVGENVRAVVIHNNQGQIRNIQVHEKK